MVVVVVVSVVVVVVVVVVVSSGSSSSGGGSVVVSSGSSGSDKFGSRSHVWMLVCSCWLFAPRVRNKKSAFSALQDDPFLTQLSLLDTLQAQRTQIVSRLTLGESQAGKKPRTSSYHQTSYK